MRLQHSSIFRGVATALITPFCGEHIHRDALSRLIEWQIQGGVKAILVAGTTGEGSTLSFAEHGELIQTARELIGGRAKLLAGCGSNCTQRACELAKIACDGGADALLAVTPYYNKASDAGILAHYEAIAKTSSRPVIVYNVPSRTGVHLCMKHYRALAQIEGIAGVKEASGDLSLLEELCAECGDALDVYTGNDDQTAAAMRLGASGVISVCSNLIPRATVDLCRACASENWQDAHRQMQVLRPLMKALFWEVNPIPVKYLAHRMGLCNEEYRLPMCPPSEETKKRLDELLQTLSALS